MLKQLTVEPCQCGYDNCSTYGFKEGIFTQGNGFTLEEATEIARRYNTYKEVKKKKRKSKSKSKSKMAKDLFSPIYESLV